MVCARATDHGVVACAAAEDVVDGVADENVIARAGRPILDNRAVRDRKVMGHVPDIRERPVIQIEILVIRKSRHIDRVYSARIPNRHDWIGVDREIIRISAGVRIEAVSGISGARRHIRTVDFLYC